MSNAFLTKKWRKILDNVIIPKAGEKFLTPEYGKPCNAGRLREAEGCRPHRLRYNSKFDSPGDMKISH